jgi:archaellum component FlaC
MWKTLSDWLLALFNMSRELQEHRDTIRRLDERVRDIEEAIKLLALELRHSRELESAEREKIVLQLERELAKLKELRPPGGKRNR